jgi:hypothetical protein
MTLIASRLAKIKGGGGTRVGVDILSVPRRVDRRKVRGKF